MFEMIISSVGACAGAFFAAAILLRDRARSFESIYLAAAVGLLALNMLEDALTASRVYDAAPWLFGWSYPAFVLIGPMIWLHTVAAADPAAANLGRARRHLLGAIALLVALSPWLLARGDLRWRIETGLAAPTLATVRTMASLVLYLVFSAIQLGIYLMAALRRAGAIVAPNKRRWTRIMTAIAVTTWAFYLMALFAMLMGFTGAPVTIINSLLALAIYSLAMVAIALPPDPLSTPRAHLSAAPKYARSALSEDDVARLTAKLNAAIQERQVHLDHTLTLHKLAKSLQASANDLSQTLNVTSGGFHEWLARARVQTALEKIQAGEDTASFLDLALAVGFNSKSTFYEAFRRVTGQTPAAWRAALNSPSQSPSGRVAS